MLVRFICFIFLSFSYLFSLDFTVTEKGKSLDDNNTILIFGGMQGDEPGGFHAASLLISDYNITKGKIIVAPNLAFDSIIKRSRGANGDLNRKFASLSPKDPDYKTVQRIKKLILRDEVGMIINLHDGWGFYRPTFMNAKKNPKRWGNSGVIDTHEINASKYSRLDIIAQSAVEAVNSFLIDPKHRFFVKNTKTKELDDTEMLKALTYFAISNNKAAFANEASKDLPVHLRVYYHLLAIEHYLNIAGIEFTRSFELNPEEIKKVINQELHIKLFGNKILYILDKPKPSINYVPTPIYGNLGYETSNELTAIIAEQSSFFVQYGNNFQTRLFPEYFEFSYAFDEFELIVDGVSMISPFASKIVVNDTLMIPKMNGVRVNVIGFDYAKDESGIEIRKKDMQRQFSLDAAGRYFRVEFYELRNANLNQQFFPKTDSKNIDNAPYLSERQYQEALKKDKFLGSILVEFK
ncbi:M99 family carboxypeptidase catalytic domain-containing protein [uncultured Campylobacter sp.]|uniref:M99 family carboxypeptidase catalytic domain-containing protein n=1 Tax=uncultured Campylobacter sp. TaxID=218934 RepID=UPI00262F7E89|nr:M99 family carboxypeptidase catalytic domain-containing protein [uncultured Campylobacter sp.]